MWANNSGAGLGRHLITDYVAAPDDPVNNSMIAQHHLRSNMIGLWIKKCMTTDAKDKLRAFRTKYNFKYQYHGAAFFFGFVK